MSPRASWTSLLLVSLLLVSLLLGAGCGKKEPPAAAGAKAGAAAPGQPGPAFPQPVLEGLRRSGLAVGEFESTAARPYQARACARGEVGKLDVMTCQYDSEPAAEQARASLEQFVAGAGTGAVRRAGPLALAVADRAKIDPRGKLVDKLLKAFAGPAPK